MIPFCTSGDVGLDNTIKDLETYLPHAKIGQGLRLHTTEGEVNLKKIERWLNQLNIEKVSEMSKQRVNITINHTNSIVVDWEENITSKALLEQMPFTIKMSNLYGREMCHRFGAGSLPVKNSQHKPYSIGDISFWPPLGSLVILYEQNGEKFVQVPIGHTMNDISFLKDLSEVEVLFEVTKE